MLAVHNRRTGEVMTVAAAPAGEPGLYRARVPIFEEAGDYTYSVLIDRAPLGVPGSLVLLTLLTALPIALRRRFPIPVLGVTLAAALAAAIAHQSFAAFGPLVALYTVAAYAGRPLSLYAAGATAAALPLLFVGDPGLGFWETLAIYAVFAAAWLLGDNMRTRRERAARVKAERQANVRRAAAEERARIARELHDVIAHNVSVMVVQAGAGADVFETHPERAARRSRRSRRPAGRRWPSCAGCSAWSTRRTASARDWRRSRGWRAARAGRPGPRGGPGGELTVDRSRRALPAGIDLSAYRIVQEALTNTLKHAPRRNGAGGPALGDHVLERRGPRRRLAAARRTRAPAAGTA